MSNDVGATIAAFAVGVACMVPLYNGIQALASGQFYIKLRYRPGRYHSRKNTPFGFWLGVVISFAIGIFGLLCLCLSAFAAYRAFVG